MIDASAPRWAQCCQGADEVDGLRFDATTQRVQLAHDPELLAVGSRRSWVMYLDGDAAVTWVPCDECPMCGCFYSTVRAGYEARSAWRDGGKIGPRPRDAQAVVAVDGAYLGFVVVWVRGTTGDGSPVS